MVIRSFASDNTYNVRVLATLRRKHLGFSFFSWGPRAHIPFLGGGSMCDTSLDTARDLITGWGVHIPFLGGGSMCDTARDLITGWGIPWKTVSGFL